MIVASGAMAIKNRQAPYVVEISTTDRLTAFLVMKVDVDLEGM